MIKKLDILIVSRERKGDEIFGLGRAIRRIRDEMIHLGHSVSLLDACSWSEDDFNHETKMRRRLYWLAKCLHLSNDPIPALAERIIQVLRAKQLINKNPEFTHIWLQDSLIAIAYHWLNRKRNNIKIVVSVHGLGSSAQSGNLDGLKLDDRWMRIILWAERRALKHANLVLLPSEAARSHLVRDLGLAKPPKHWYVLGHGRPDFTLSQRKHARATLHLNHSEVLVLAIGRVAPVKRYDLVITAVAQLQQVYPNIRLIILGGTPTQDLTSLAETMNPQPLFIRSGNVPDFLAAADLYVSASAVESYGLANVEALYAGVPSVVAAGGASIEIVERGALLCAPTAQALAEAMHLILAHNSLSNRFTELAASRCSELPLWHDVTKQQIKLMLES
ncbi:MAG: glycosyltransferase family 4 protein [Candidatus Cloacimonetes bacterium]|jgi:glycosyltransferase involved in cell wall biosynthesis|nr:glycosyltransferase family 4 protein [Candidatus Cloacimonadota bacterium]